MNALNDPSDFSVGRICEQKTCFKLRPRGVRKRVAVEVTVPEQGEPKICSSFIIYSDINRRTSNKLHRSWSETVGLYTIFGLFWVSGLLWGYLATSGTKSDVIFLLSEPDFV